MQARRDERAKELELERRDDAVRIARRVQLQADMKEIRLNHLNETGLYLGKEAVRQELLKPGPHGGWAQRGKNKGVNLHLGEVMGAWTVLQHLPGFIDFSLLAGGRVQWSDVAVLEPLQQPKDAQGRVRLRTNSRSAVKLRKAHHCLLEALLFATGHATLAELNLTGFHGRKYEKGLMTHEINVKLRPTPFMLYDWQTAIAKQGSKRGVDGAERRRRITLFEIVRVRDVIIIAEAVVEDTEGRELSCHAIVWDGWRRLLFIGPGTMDDRGLDGALHLDAADCENESHVDAVHGMTISEYVQKRFGIRHVVGAHVPMVLAKRASETHHV